MTLAYRVATVRGITARLQPVEVVVGLAPEPDKWSTELVVADARVDGTAALRLVA